MTTKMLFVLPFAIATLAGCAATNDTSSPSQSSLQCANLSGSAYLECQQNVTPAANAKNKSFNAPKRRTATSGAWAAANAASGGSAVALPSRFLPPRLTTTSVR